MKAIILENGGFTYVSDIDHEYLKQWKWQRDEMIRNTKHYAVRTIKKGDSRSSIRMHRVIIARMNLIIPEGYCVDHIDQDSLNNDRENLRVVTYSDNSHNSKIRKDNISGVRGVNYDIKNKKWRARITINNKRILLGFFNTIENATIARVKAEGKYLK